MPKAKPCANMDEIRENIDRLDALIVPLLAERIGYVEQAAQFKETRADVHVPWRIEAIVERVRTMAGSEGANPDFMEKVYRYLIDSSIDREWMRWDELNGDS